MTKNNKNISITAEFVSIMRAEKDKNNLLFVSPRGKTLFAFTQKIFSQKKLQKIFEWRLKLSKIFDDKIQQEEPEQVIDLAAGYSLRGFNMCLKDKNLIFIDVDFDNVLSRKRKILDSICLKNNFEFPKNYFLIDADLLSEKLIQNIQKITQKDKKTLIISEGLTSYFSLNEFKLFLKNVNSLIYHFDNAEFYSHENIKQPKGFVYFVLRFIFVSFLTRSKRRKMFKSKNDFEQFLKGENIRNYTLEDGTDFLMYSLKKLND